MADPFSPTAFDLVAAMSEEGSEGIASVDPEVLQCEGIPSYKEILDTHKKEDASKDDTSKDDASKDDASKEGSSKEGTPKEEEDDQEMGDASKVSKAAIGKGNSKSKANQGVKRKEKAKPGKGRGKGKRKGTPKEEEKPGKGRGKGNAESPTAAGPETKPETKPKKTSTAGKATAATPETKPNDSAKQVAKVKGSIAKKLNMPPAKPKPKPKPKTDAKSKEKEDQAEDEEEDEEEDEDDKDRDAPINAAKRAGLSAKELNVTRMRFHRSTLQSSGKRCAKATAPSKCPKELLDKMTCPKSKDILFKIWSECKEEWGRVMMYVKKYSKTYEKGKTVDRWMTLKQLEKHFGDKDLAKEVAKGCPSRPHKNLEKDDPDMAKNFPQYMANVVDEEEKGWEKGTETGMVLESEVAKGDEAIAQMVAALDEIGGFKTSGGKPELTDAEKAAKKAEAEVKKQEKEAALAADPKLRAKAWLKGISADITKFKTAEAEASSIRDHDLRNLYNTKFKNHIALLGKFRTEIENAVSKKSSCFEESAEPSRGGHQTWKVRQRRVEQAEGDLHG